MKWLSICSLAVILLTGCLAEFLAGTAIVGWVAVEMLTEDSGKNELHRGTVEHVLYLYESDRQIFFEDGNAYLVSKGDYVSKGDVAKIITSDGVVKVELIIE